MSLEKAKIEDAIYDVLDVDEYYNNYDLYADEKYIAIKGNDGYVYPVRKSTDMRPGFYPTGGLDFFKQPMMSEAAAYSQQNIIDFHSPSIKDVISSQQKLAAAERTILTTIDNVFTPDISVKDAPEMAALKQAIIDKHIDIDKYEPRIGPNYNNDKRLLRKPTITFNKLKGICNALDMKVTLTIEDSDPNVPNPIGRAIVTELTNGNGIYYGDDGEETGETEE